MKFQKDKFMEDYTRWRSLSFPTETAEADEVYELRYDVFELDTFMAGSFITLVDSNFRDIDYELNDEKLNNLLSQAKDLKNTLEGNDNEQVDKYIDYMNLLASMYENYKHLSHS